jgi:hypothetical protein
VTNSNLPAIDASELRASTTANGVGLMVALDGTADLRSQEQLDDFLEQLDRCARALKTPEVIVDLRKLEFMNSSCFKAFVSWIGRLQELDATEQYKIRFLSDQRMLWQRRSLHALSCFAVDLITIENSHP